MRIINFFMYFVISLIVFVVFFSALEWLIKKTGFDSKLVNKINKYKYYKTVLFFIIFVFGLLGEYAKQLLNERFGQHNIRSIILGTIIICVYVKFMPFIFTKNKEYS